MIDFVLGLIQSVLGAFVGELLAGRLARVSRKEVEDAVRAEVDVRDVTPDEADTIVDVAMCGIDLIVKELPEIDWISRHRVEGRAADEPFLIRRAVTADVGHLNEDLASVVQRKRRVLESRTEFTVVGHGDVTWRQLAERPEPTFRVVSH